MDDVGGFELVREEVPYHECGHYHWPGYDCPTARTCTSELCCVFGGAPDLVAE